MAKLEYSGIDDLILSMEQVANIPENVQDEILNAQADVLVPEIRERGYAYGAYSKEDGGGKMLQSIKKGKPKKGKKGGRQIVVSARGSRKRGNTVTKNSEIAFLINYGKRGVQALPFWSDAEKLSEKTMDKAGGEVYDKYLTKQGL